MNDIPAAVTTPDDRPSLNAVQFALAPAGEAVCVCGRLLRVVVAENVLSATILFDGVSVEARFSVQLDAVVGDIISAVGTIRIVNGARVVEAVGSRVLTRTARPDAFSGAADAPREVELVRDIGLRQSLEARRQVLRATRQFLDAQGYREVDTPVILPVRDIAPVSHFSIAPSRNGQHVLRICPENALKRLVVAGFDSIYEVARNFRAADMDGTRLPEFTTVECYRAYSHYLDMADLFERWVRHVVHAVTGSYRIHVGGQEVDFQRPWARIDFSAAVATATGINIDEHSDFESLRAAMHVAGIPTDDLRNRRESVNRLGEQVEASLVQPSFLMNHPAETICVAKRHDEPHLAHRLERCEAFVAGVELAHAFTELTDGIEQRRRMQSLLDEKVSGGDAPHPLDDGFLTAIDIGLPPTAGLGVGIDRLVMLVTGEPIDRVLPFPFTL